MEVTCVSVSSYFWHFIKIIRKHHLSQWMLSCTGIISCDESSKYHIIVGKGLTVAIDNITSGGRAVLLYYLCCCVECGSHTHKNKHLYAMIGRVRWCLSSPWRRLSGVEAIWSTSYPGVSKVSGPRESERERESCGLTAENENISQWQNKKRKHTLSGHLDMRAALSKYPYHNNIWSSISDLSHVYWLVFIRGERREAQ